MSRKIVSMPSSLAGIKRLAKKIKAEEGIPHQVSQNIAAQRAGYENYRHAYSSIKNAPSKVKVAYITVYWKSENDSGRLTLGVPLEVTIAELLSAHQVRYSTPRLFGFKLEFKDHIERIHDVSTFMAANEAALEAASALLFVQMTGLLSPPGTQQKKLTSLIKQLPGSDHPSFWSAPGDPEKWVILDEPYAEFDRKDWAQEHGVGSSPAWNQGIYRGGHQPTTVFAATDEYATEIATVLTRISYKKAEATVASGDYDSAFVSPARKSSGVVRRPRPMPLPENVVLDNSISYGFEPGEYSSWRPAEAMAIEKHLQIGPILEALRYEVPHNAQRPLWSASLTLCNWFFREHGDAITDEIDHAYNGIGDSSPAWIMSQKLISADLKCEALAEVISIISSSYPICPPLSAVVKKLRLVSKHLSTKV